MKHKARLVLGNQVWKEIKWLSYNFDKEIAALGVGKIRIKDGEKELFIDKLFYPKQEVSYATIHLSHEMWADLIKNPEFKERMGDVCFYWHRHPGSAAHSQTDDDDTFEAFMTPESKRKWFAFMQTAVKQDNSLDIEARIDISTPLRVTITHDDIELLHEPTPEDAEFKAHMESVIKNSVVEKPTYVPKTDCAFFRNSNYPETSEDDKTIRDMFSTYESNKAETYMDNSFISGKTIEDDFKVSLTFKNGAARVLSGPKFRQALQAALGKGGKLYGVIRSFQEKETATPSKMKEYHFQPNKNSYKDMKTVLIEMFISFNKKIMGNDSPPKTDKITEGINVLTDSVVELIGKDEIETTLAELSYVFDLRYDTDEHCLVYDIVGKDVLLGNIRLNENNGRALVQGKSIVDVMKVMYNLDEEDMETKCYNGGWC